MPGYKRSVEPNRCPDSSQKPDAPRWTDHAARLRAVLAASVGLVSLGLWMTWDDPARAAQEQDVQLQVELSAPLNAEKGYKALLDEWASTAFDIQFTPRTELDSHMPGWVRLRLEGLRVAFNADWYKRYKTAHDDLIKQPFAQAVLRRAVDYCRQGDPRLEATLLDATGKVLLSAKVWNTRAPSHFQPVEATLFSADLLRPLPDTPPSLLQLWELPPGEVPYIQVPAKLLPNVKRIRIGDLAQRRWPIDLTDPFAAPPPPPAVPSAKPGAPSPAPGTPRPPGGAAPALTPPKL